MIDFSIWSGLLIPIFVVVVILFYAFRILREYERDVVFMLGRLWKVKGPGLVIIIPFVQQMVRVDLRTRVLDVPPQDVISRDNVSVRVNAVVPGLIRTYHIDDAAAAERGQVVPMGRLGDPEDLAGPTVFLATDDARYITGACLVVNGGVLVQQRSTPVDTFPLSRFPKI